MKIKIGVSNRHIHLCKKDFDELFCSTELSVLKNLSQQGEFASTLTVSIKTNKGVLSDVRIIGPLRDRTQVEISRTDAYKLGINPPVRMSGDLDNSESVVLESEMGSVKVDNCCILAHRHIHMGTKEATELGYKNGDVVSVKIDGERAGILENVKIRIKDNFKLELHLDTDEANAFLVNNESVGEVYGRKDN